MAHNHLALDLTGLNQDMSDMSHLPQSIELALEYDQQNVMPSDGHMDFSPVSQVSNKDPISRFYMTNDGPWHHLKSGPGAVSHRVEQFGPHSSGRPSLGHSELDSGYGSYQQVRHSVTNDSVCDETLDTNFDEQSMVYSVQDSFQIPDTAWRQRTMALETQIRVDEMRCAVCQKTVRTKSELKKHNQRHTKPFKCDVEECPRHAEGFSTTNDLDRHKRSVHPNRQADGNRYICPLGSCKTKVKIWPRADNFKAHLKRLHQKENVTDDELTTYQYKSSSADPDSSQLDNRQETQSEYSEISNTTYDQTSTWPPFDSPQKISSTTNFNRGQNAANTTLPSSQHGANGMSVSMSRVMSRQESYPTTVNAESQSATIPSSVMENNQLSANTEISEIVPALQLNTTTGRAQALFQDGVSGPYDSQPIVSNDSSQYQNATDESLRTEFESDAGFGPLTSPLTTSNSSQPNVAQVSLDLNDPNAVKELLMKLQTEGVLAQHGYKQENVDAPDPPIREVRKDDSRLDGHACMICNKVFPRRCELKKHEKRHEKPYGCTQPDCDKRFGSKNDWKRHENTQHFMLESWRCEEKKSNFDTELCERVCYRRENFRVHLEVDHQITDQHALERRMEKCRVGRNCEARFWCGFCQKIVEIKQKNMQPWVERFNHIDEHFTGKNKRPLQEIGEWKNFDSTQPKKGSPPDDSDSISDAGVVTLGTLEAPVARPNDVSFSSSSDHGRSKSKRKRDENNNASGTKKNRQAITTSGIKCCCQCGELVMMSSQPQCMCEHIPCIHCRG